MFSLVIVTSNFFHPSRKNISWFVHTPGIGFSSVSNNSSFLEINTKFRFQKVILLFSGADKLKKTFSNVFHSL